MGTARALHRARKTRRDVRPTRTADGRGRALASSLRLRTQEEGERAGRGHQPEALRCLWTRPYIVKTRKQAEPSWESLQGAGVRRAGRPAGSPGQSGPCALLDLPGIKPEATRAGRYNLGPGEWGVVSLHVVPVFQHFTSVAH